jgi:hypothetical protein
MPFVTSQIMSSQKTKVDLDQIGNMIEVPLTFDIPMTRTVDKVGTKTIPIKTTGHEKCSGGTILLLKMPIPATAVVESVLLVIVYDSTNRHVYSQNIEDRETIHIVARF